MQWLPGRNIRIQCRQWTYGATRVRVQKRQARRFQPNPSNYAIQLQISASAAALTAAVVTQPKTFSQRPLVCSPIISRLLTANMMIHINAGASRPITTEAQNKAEIGLKPEIPIAIATPVESAIPPYNSGAPSGAFLS